MKPDAADNSVPREIRALLSNERLILRETQRAVTPLGGIAVFVGFLHKLGLVEQLRQPMPIQWKSPNYIDPTATFIAFLLAVLAGAKRFAHANWLRNDRAWHALLGLSRFPLDDTMRNLFRRFGLGDVQRLFDPLAEWQMERLPQRSDGYSLDLDSTVFERYGQQQGSLQGHNPRKHGRPSHHPLLAVLAEAHCLLHGWRSRARRGGVSPRSPGTVGTAPEDSPGASCFRLLRGQAAELFRTALAVLHCGSSADQMDQARSPAGQGLAGAGRKLFRQRVPRAAAGLGARTALCGGARTGARRP